MTPLHGPLFFALREAPAVRLSSLTLSSKDVRKLHNPDSNEKKMSSEIKYKYGIVYKMLIIILANMFQIAVESQ